MRILTRCWHLILRFWGRIWKAFFPSRRINSFVEIVRVEPHTSSTDELKARQLILVAVSGKNKWLKFICPCGCGDIQALNLMQSHRPCWTITSHKDGTLSVHPSVDAQKCGAHFWIRHNQIHWC